MSADDDFMGPAEIAGVQRDRWKRPLLIPAGETKRVPYTRASTLGETLVPKFGLSTWQQRYLAKGMGDNEDLAAMAAALPPLTGDNEADRPTFAALDPIIEQAMDRAGVHVKAHWGTAIHGFTDELRASGHIPERMATDVEAAQHCLKKAGAEVRATELFVACDPVRSAGTFDKEVEYPDVEPGVIRVLDTKTGVLNPHEWLIQLAVYVWGDLYDPTTDDRFERPNVDKEWAEVMWVPRGQGQAYLFELDMVKGWEMAQIARKVKDYLTDKTVMRPKDPEDHLLSLIAVATTARQLTNLWKKYADDWTERHTAAARARKADLASA